jgi:hypothetical protein
VPPHACHYTLALVEFDGEHDFVCVLVNYPPSVSVYSLVSSLKGVSSRLIRQQTHPTMRSESWGGALWSPTYSAQLRWRSDHRHSPIHRATASNALRTASPSTLSFLALKGEVCRYQIKGLEAERPGNRAHAARAGLFILVVPSLGPTLDSGPESRV